MAEIQRQKKQQLADQIDRNFQNVTQSTNDVSYKIVTNNDDDAKAMEEHMIAMKKQDLFEATDTFKFSREPQIQPGHYNEFKGLMNSIGILNPNEIDSLWKHIDVTVNGDKREDIIIRAHSITKSVDIDNKEKNKNNVNNIRFRNEMNQNETIELQNTIKELQKELQSLKKQREQEEDDYSILDSGIETAGADATYIDENDDEFDYTQTTTTKGGPDPNQIELQGMEKPLEEQQGFINFKNEMNEKINTLKQERINDNQEIKRLNEEIKRISNSKIELLMNTSKEIDSLRQLLSDYVNLANQQRNKNNRNGYT